MKLNISDSLKPKKSTKHILQKGSALVYILIAIALLAALTVTFMEPSSQQTSSQSSFKTLTAIQSQLDVIRASIQDCVLQSGPGTGKSDTTVDTGGAGTDPDARTTYPLKPNSTHFTGATPGPAAGRLVRDLRCPNLNPGGANINDHELIFSGSSGKFLPPAPDLFEDWQYYNAIDGVFFWTQTNKTDAFLATALAKLDEKFAECEVDVVDATGGSEDLDSNSEVSCPNGYQCLRVRMFFNAPAVWNGDTDNDENAC